ncbi:MAG: hypothetical protein ACPGWR_09405 [Ardenticatenaceae bacterium]
MERLRQVVGTEGLQIPWPIMQQYGFKPGAGVVLELESNSIRILSATKSTEEIENQALRTLLKHLGDAVTVTVVPSNEGWCVSVYGSGLSESLGRLVYTPAGELLAHRSTPFVVMRNVAMEAFAKQ